MLNGILEMLFRKFSVIQQLINFLIKLQNSACVKNWKKRCMKTFTKNLKYNKKKKAKIEMWERGVILDILMTK